MKEKRILYVDLLSPAGHLNFNRIYLAALNLIPDIVLDVVFEEDYLEKLELSRDQYDNFYSFNKLKGEYKGLVNKIVWRIHQLYVLLFCRRLLSREHYDAVFFSSFEEVSLFLLGPSKINSIAVCHANADNAFKSSLSKSILRVLSRRYHLVTLNKALSQLFNIGGIRNKYVPHGVPQLLGGSETSRNLFIPIQIELADKSILAELITPVFSKLLVDLNLKLVLRSSKDFNKDLPNIIYVDKVMSKEDYATCLKDTGMIILPYQRELYQYRTSAMLMESVALNKFVLIPRTSSFESLVHEKDYGIFIYDGINDICQVIKRLFSSGTIESPNYYNMLQEQSKGNIANSLLDLMN